MPAVPPTADLEQAAARLLLDEGLASLTFGRLSRATGVSDRMLVYRFGTKAVLVERALAVVVDGLREQLAGLVDPGPVVPADLLDAFTATLSSPEHAAVLATWLEVLAGAARRDPVCASAAQQVAGAWHAWLVDVLHEQEDPTAAALDVLGRLEGALVLHVAGLTGPSAARPN